MSSFEGIISGASATDLRAIAGVGCAVPEVKPAFKLIADATVSVTVEVAAAAEVVTSLTSGS